MRTFLLVSSRAAFAENPYVHAKALVASLLYSNGIRTDAEFILYLVDEGSAVRVSGASVRSLFPDEESAAGLLRRALRRGKHPGVRLIRGVKLRDLARRPVIDGSPGSCRPADDFTYVAYIERGEGLDADCGSGWGPLPPHHQFVVANIEADRAHYL